MVINSDIKLSGESCLEDGGAFFHLFLWTCNNQRNVIQLVVHSCLGWAIIHYFFDELVRNQGNVDNKNTIQLDCLE